MSNSILEVYKVCERKARKAKELDRNLLSEECLKYNRLIKNLPVDDRNLVSERLYYLVKYYQTVNKGIGYKKVVFKPQTLQNSKNSNIYIYDLSELPEKLAHILLICLRDFIFPE